ncbi:MAG: hypothetical protein ACHQWH_02255 [Nitrososphaerales archaeon]
MDFYLRGSFSLSVFPSLPLLSSFLFFAQALKLRNKRRAQLEATTSVFARRASSTTLTMGGGGLGNPNLPNPNAGSRSAQVGARASVAFGAAGARQAGGLLGGPAPLSTNSGPAGFASSGSTSANAASREEAQRDDELQQLEVDLTRIFPLLPSSLFYPLLSLRGSTIFLTPLRVGV